jgi:hypothetical protein
MPDLNQDRQALDWAVSNQHDPRASAVMQKLGVDKTDLQAWQYSAQNADDPRSTQIRNKIFDKVAAVNPAVQQQGVSFIERFAIKNLISEDTDLQQNYLRKKGYETRVVGDNVEVRRPGDQRFQVIDPSGLDLWDVTDIAGDALEAIAAARFLLIGGMPLRGFFSGLSGFKPSGPRPARSGI